MWRRRKRDYNLNKRHVGPNPFVATKKNRGRKVIGGTMVLFLLIVGLGYGLSTYPALQLTSVAITGTTVVSHDDITHAIEIQLQERRWGIFPQRSRFFFDTTMAEQTIRQAFNLTDVRVRHSGQQVVVEVTEQQPAAVVRVDDMAYYLNADGNVIRAETYQSHDTSLVIANSKEAIVRKQVTASAFPEIMYQGTIAESEDGSGVVGQNLISKRLIEYIGQLHQALSQNSAVVIKNYELQHSDQDFVVAQAIDGWKVYFATNDSIDQQLQRLTILLSQKIKNLQALEYIDLRYGDKVFYK